MLVGILLGLLVTGVGLAVAFKPYPVARFNERLDAIGSTTPWDEVEPAGWRVTLTRCTGLGFVIVGVTLLSLALGG